MKKIVSIFVLILVSRSLFCQIYSLDFHAGYSTYQLNSIKDYQLDMKDAYSHFSPKAVEKFPDYFNCMFTAGYWINNKNMIGINGGYYTTGGRNHVADYSGEFKLDMIIKGFRLGLQYQYVYFTTNSFSLYAQARAGSILSVFKEEMSLHIYDISSAEYSSKYRSITFFGEPSVGIEYPLINKFSLDLNAGYQFDTNGKLHKKGDKDIVLKNAEDKNVKVNWTGLRISLGVTYYLSN